MIAGRPSGCRTLAEPLWISSRLRLLAGYPSAFHMLAGRPSGFRILDGCLCGFCTLSGCPFGFPMLRIPRRGFGARLHESD